MLFFYGILVFRLYDLTINLNSKYNTLSIKNIKKEIFILPPRGIILDRNSIPLAYNELKFNISLKPHLDMKELNDSIYLLKTVFKDINTTKLIKTYKNLDSFYNHKPITILSYLDEDLIYKNQTFLNIDENIIIKPTYLRKYPFAKPLANVLGYVSKADKNDLQRNKIVSYTKIAGKRGVEKYYDDILQGELGKKSVIVNAKNEILKEISFKNFKTHTLTLSIDSKLQTLFIIY